MDYPTSECARFQRFENKIFFRKLQWMCFTIMFLEFMFAYAMEEHLMAKIGLEKLTGQGVKVSRTVPKKYSIGSSVGNLEWRKVVAFLIQSLPKQLRPAEKESDVPPTW